jgi:hypothetical protein
MHPTAENPTQRKGQELQGDTSNKVMIASVTVARSRWILGFQSENLKPLVSIGIETPQRRQQERIRHPKAPPLSAQTEVGLRLSPEFEPNPKLGEPPEGSKTMEARDASCRHGFPNPASNLPRPKEKRVLPPLAPRGLCPAELTDGRGGGGWGCDGGRPGFAPPPVSPRGGSDVGATPPIFFFTRVVWGY